MLSRRCSRTCPQRPRQHSAAAPCPSSPVKGIVPSFLCPFFSSMVFLSSGPSPKVLYSSRRSPPFLLGRLQQTSSAARTVLCPHSFSPVSYSVSLEPCAVCCQGFTENLQ